MKEYINKVTDKISNWWNKISYVEIELSNSSSILKIPRKYVKIGFETDIKTLGLKDIKRCGYCISNIYPRLVISHPETWELKIPKRKNYKDQGLFELPYINLGKGFSNNLYKSALLLQDIKYIDCFGKWYRICFGFFKTKPYFEIFRSNWVLNVPWDTKVISKNKNDVEEANKEQSVVIRHITTQSIKNHSVSNYSGYVEFEIRWGDSATSVFKDSKEKFYTWRDITKNKNKQKRESENLLKDLINFNSHISK